MEYKIKAYSISEAGTKVDKYGNPHQEDSVWPGVGAIAEGERLFIVCDGMGGHDHGEIASDVVCRALGESIDKRMRAADGVFNPRMLNPALGDAYSALDANDTHAAKKMGTTLAVLALYPDGFMTAHIGDSRVYHIRPGIDADATRILFCTEDHSLENSRRRAGTFDPSAPRKHVITRAMQPNVDNQAKADVYTSADVLPGDYFLVCSHGLLENIDLETIKYIFSKECGSDRNKQNTLSRMASANRDNYSAIVVHIEEVLEYENRSTAKTTTDTNMQSEMTNDRESQPTQRRKKASRTARKSNSSGIGTLVLKFLLALILLLSVIMVVYYAFIRHDETPPQAGKATNGEAIEEIYEPDPEPVEKYGYETNPTTKTDDDNVGKGKDESIQEVKEVEDGAGVAPESEAKSEPEPDPDPEPAPEPPISE